MQSCLRVVWFSVVLVCMSLTASAVDQPTLRFALEPDDHIVVIGNTFGERMALSGYFDALAYASHIDHKLVIRSVPWSADEVGIRPREMNVPTVEDYLKEYEADVIVMYFGMSESFAGVSGLTEFEQKLDAQITAFKSATFNGESPPRLILVSPIAHEDLGAPMVTGTELEERNSEIEAYATIMQTVAAQNKIQFIDLFQTSIDIYEKQSTPLTSNGIHPNEIGCYFFANEIAKQLVWLTEPDDDTKSLAYQMRWNAYDKYYHERMLYRPTNSEYVFGRRHKPYGIVNFPAERAQLKKMIQTREHAIWAMKISATSTPTDLAPSGKAIWEKIPTSNDFPEDNWTPEPVEAKGQENSLGSMNILPPDEFIKSFTLPEGYAINCFASEEDFEELENPLAMTFDAKGRLWVLCTPTYPHLLPGEAPRCRLLILEDTDNDGHADKRVIFADKLYIPTGFAIDTDAVYIGQAPDLWKFTDTDGDDVADRREIVASGFGMPDSHHQLSAFEWDPNGGILFHEGVFTKSNVETPYGTLRTVGAAVWRFDTRTQQLQIMSHCNFANPWGHAFDDYGQSMLADASGGDNFSFSHVIMQYEYPRKPKRVGRLLHRGRPTAGCELISSRNFPDDVQDSFLVNQSIGYHGTRWDRMFPDQSSWRTESMPQDLLQSSDTNFRPVAMEIGPDGALYIADWCNPLIGHMQYSVRDPRRDHSHGRIWRIRNTERSLVTPPEIDAFSVLSLLEQLRLPERNTRQHARRFLQKLPGANVFPELTRWMAGVDPSDPLYDRLMLESLWIHQAQGRVDLELLDRVAMLSEPRARAGAIRVLRHWLQQSVIDPVETLYYLERAVNDKDMRVRLEGVLACGFIPSMEGAAIAAVAAEHPMDDGLRIVMEETIVYLAKYGEPDSEVVRRLRLERMPVEELLALPINDLIAEVQLLRVDVPLEKRNDALTHLAGNTGVDRVARLTTELQNARHGDLAVVAIAPLLLSISNQHLNTASDALEQVASNNDPHVRALAIAAMTRSGASSASLFNGDVALTTMVLAHLQLGDAPQELVTLLKKALEENTVNAKAAIEQIVRHSNPTPDFIKWLTAQIDTVSDKNFDTFDSRHHTAMAALNSLNQISRDYWPENSDRYLVKPASSDVYQLGRDIYNDEVIGCVRCHDVDGTGKEGFPPLNHSAWVVGNAQRAAAIVIHGLFGEVNFPDGSSFNAVMDPLGANLDDEQIAAVLTYVRQTWGNYAPVVSTNDVQASRSIKDYDGLPLHIAVLSKEYPLANDMIIPAVLTVAQPVDEVISDQAKSKEPVNWWYYVIGIIVAGAAIFGFVIWRKQSAH